MKRTKADIAAQAIGGRLIRTCEGDGFTGVVHDSRECGPEDLFVCIKGENNDGHRYLESVYVQGCRNVLISDEAALPRNMAVNAILVEDTVKALGQLATWYLAGLDLIRIAVTGSVGKTSTRDMLYYVLNEKYPCVRNKKNYNNHIGLPLSIFQADESHRAIVLEMGMSDFGEIDYLASMVRPHIGVVTNIGVAHMEHLGSREGIFKAKMELARHVLPREEGGTMIFVHDDEFLTRERTAGDYESIFVGDTDEADYRIGEIADQGIGGICFELDKNGNRQDWQVPVAGRHNAYNAAVAIAAGEHLGESAQEIRAGLEKVQLTGSRLRVVRGDGITVIDDTYNASPASMKAALMVLESSSCAGKRIAILGDMFELGEDSEKMHYDVGAFAAGCGIDLLVGVGQGAEAIVRGAREAGAQAVHMTEKKEFNGFAEENIGEGDLVLVKASRGMALEEIVETLTHTQETTAC